MASLGKDVLILGVAVCLLLQTLIPYTDAGCGSSCGSCTRRYGCMTPAWGKCCTHFFMQNGKRSAVKKSVQRLVEYIKLKREIYPGEDKWSSQSSQDMDESSARSLLPVLETIFPVDEP